MDWVYKQIIGFLANFFAEMGNMGAEMFEMSWVQSIVLFFSYLAWILYAVGFVVACAECGLEYSSGRADIKGTAMNLIKGFMAVSLFSVVPVKLYELCVSLQANFGYAISGEGASFGTVAGNIIDELTVENFVDFATTHVGGFNSVTSSLMVLFCIILMAYAVIKVFFANLKRGGILLIQIAVGSLYISLEAFDALAKRRMENTGEVSGVFELDFDARTISALNIMDGWKVYAMQDVADAAEQAFQKAEISEDDRWRIFLDRLDGQELTTPSRLTARNFYFEDSIEAMDDRTLNFYVVPCFNVDEVFGTFVETDENDHALNIYANYDMQRQQVCDTLEMTLYGSGIDDQSLTYHLNAAEKEVLREKMEAYCMQREHMPLNQLCQEILQEQDAPTQEMQM